MRTREGNKERDILQAAIRVFSEYGFHNAKISKIAEEAGVATGSVYLYFANKNEILQHIFRDLWKEMSANIETLMQCQDLNSAQKLDGMIDLIFDRFIHKPDLAIVFVNEQNHLLMTGSEMFREDYERFLVLGGQIVQEGIHNGIFRPDTDLDVLRSFVFGGVRYLMHQWAQDPERMPLLRIRQSVKSIIKTGILSS